MTSLFDPSLPRRELRTRLLAGHVCERRRQTVDAGAIMSPQVRLVCYPSADRAFGAHTALHLKIDLPIAYSPEEVVIAIQERLRQTYPLAHIEVQAPDGGDGEITWHVFRDGIGADN